MAPVLFAIACPTCKARLAVRSAKDIGQIVMCPKCDSMVPISAPPDWQPPSAVAPAPAPAADSSKSAAAPAPATKPAVAPTPSGPTSKPAAAPPASAGSTTPKTSTAAEAGATPARISGETTAPPKVAQANGEALVPTPAAGAPPVAPAVAVPARENRSLVPLVTIAVCAAFTLAAFAFLLGGMFAPRITPVEVAQNPPASPAPAVPTSAPSTTAPAPAETAPLPAPSVAETPAVAAVATSPATTPAGTVPPVTTPPAATVVPEATAPAATVPPAVTGTAAAPAATVAVVPPVPQPQGPPQAPVDWNERLGLKVEQVEFAQTPLADALSVLAQLAGGSLALEVEALGEVGISPEEKVTQKLEGMTLEEAFQTLLEPRQLALVPVGTILRVTSVDRDSRTTSVENYPLGDLTSAAKRPASHFVGLLTPLLPGSGESAPKCNLEGDVLSVAGNAAVQRVAAEWYERLRRAYLLPPLDPRRLKQWSLQPRFAQADKELAATMTVNFRETPLERVVAYLERRGNVKLLVDHAGLGGAGISTDLPVTLAVPKAAPLREVLGKLLDPLDSTWRVTHGSTLQITSRKGAAGMLELEFHPVGDLVPAKLSADELLAGLRSDGVAIEALGQGFAATFDPHSGQLMIRTSQATQIEAAEWLQALRRPREQEKAAPPGKEPPTAARKE